MESHPVRLGGGAKVGADVVVRHRDRPTRWFVLAGPGYEETGSSALLGVSVTELAGQIEWPA